MKHIEEFNLYYERLIETNKNVNLTAITDRRDVFIKHFEDSLSLSLAVPDLSEKEYRVIDVGTGAGFPGLPLAIEYPNIRVTLSDSLEKRLVFLRKVVQELGLKNVEIVHARAEDLAHDVNYREKYDIATCRAVAKLSTIVEYCIPFVHNNGLFIPLKSADIVSEIESAENALSILSCKIKEIKSYELTEGMGSRSLIVIQKLSTTLRKYPRKAGTPSKNPL